MTQNTRTVEELVARLKASRNDAWQYLEVKQMAEILARHREKARLAVREYRLLKRALAAETDAIEKLYLGYEGMFLRDHLRDALRLYVMVNHDYHDALRTYMEALRHPAEPVVQPIIMMDEKQLPAGKALRVLPVANGRGKPKAA